MKHCILTCIALLALTGAAAPALAQGPQGKDFGFGIILGEPLGGTVKYWTDGDNALVFDIGGSYFGAPRIQVDYLWHFNAFNSQVVKLYAGPGLGLGLGHGGGGWYYKGEHGYWYYRDDNSLGVGIRCMFGLNVIPKRTPIEVFLEVGPMIGIVPGFGSAFDAAVGVRFYP